MMMLTAKIIDPHQHHHRHHITIKSIKSLSTYINIYQHHHRVQWENNTKKKTMVLGKL
jgi:hypothetical protein